MALRCGLTVGRTTGEASLAEQLKRYQPRVLPVPEVKATLYSTKKANSSHEKLYDKCIKVVVENIATKASELRKLPPKVLAEVVEQLPTSLSPVLTAKYIHSEGYWKRSCVEKYGWAQCDLTEHGFMWKQLYFEKLLSQRLEDFDSQTDDSEALYDLIDASMDYIFTVTIRQLPSHIDVSELCSLLPNLTKLDIAYGVKKIGMAYERILFGMKISDATSLAKTFDRTETLTTVIMSSNLVDDDLLRMLMTGLIKNNTITHLDFSHNKITDHGARLLSKLLEDNSVISVLNLADNQIHTEGGRYIARGLRANDSLQFLNLRLNRLEDDGVRFLLEGMEDNTSVTDLNISANGAGAKVGKAQ
jgi:Leucine Rich repeat